MRESLDLVQWASPQFLEIDVETETETEKNISDSNYELRNNDSFVIVTPLSSAGWEIIAKIPMLTCY